MEVLPAFFITFFVIVFVLGPLFAEEDRPGFKLIGRTPKMPVGSWFRDVHRR